MLSAGSAAADDRPRLAQRWTPLTGILAPEGETQEEPVTKEAEPPAKAEPVPKAEPAPKPKPEPAKPADAAADVPTDRLPLKATVGRTVSGGQPYGALGIRAASVDDDLAEGLGLGAARGALVTEAVAGTARAGLRTGDVIQKVDGREIADAEALAQALRDLKSDQEVSVDVWRAGEGAADLKRLLTAQADAGNVGAAASLGRLLSLGIVLGPKDFGTAARYYLKAAEAGHVASMTRYALFAKDGIGLPKNEAVAATWFRKAAEAGQDAAMTNLGLLHEAGRGVAQSDSEAARWYRRAADKGHVFAMHRLALLYEAGRGVKKDDQEAVRLFRAASDKGLSEATNWLAEKYEQGRGIPRDEGEAQRLNARAADQVRRAAEQGNAVATFNLGILYRIGKGVKKSDTEAAYWVVRSLKLGDKYLVSELMRNPDVLTLADRKWLQEVLRDEGTYKGPINGTFTPQVRAAMEALAGQA